MSISKGLISKFIIILLSHILIICHKSSYKNSTVKIPKSVKPCLLVESVFGSERPGTVFFDYNSNFVNKTKSIKNNRRFNPKAVLDWKKPEHKDFVVTYTHTASASNSKIVKQTLDSNGIVIVKEDSDANMVLKLLNATMIKNVTGQMNRYRRYNLVPIISSMTSKDNMWRQYKKMRNKFPEDYNYMRDTFLIPEEWKQFNETFASSKDKVWIRKPKNLSRGIGVELIDSLEEIPKSALLTHYISNPFLIYNRKLDIRFYVVVTGVDPLRVYIYKEGYVSFAAEEFTLNKSEYKNKCVHLTQFAIGKNSSNFDRSKLKMSTFELKDYLDTLGIDFDNIWTNIKDSVLKAVLLNVDTAMNEIPKINKNKNVFHELYGVDVTFDANLKPWLFEFNLRPDLSELLPVDTRIKNMMIADMFTLIGLTPYSRTSQNMEDPDLFHDTIYNRIQKHNCRTNAVTELEVCVEFNTIAKERVDQLMYCIDEFSRQGGFERMFPVKETVDYYSKFIKNPGPDNKLLWKWLKNPELIENELDIKRVHGPEYDV